MLSGSRARVKGALRRLASIAVGQSRPESGAVLPVEPGRRVVHDEPPESFLWLDRPSAIKQVRRAQARGLCTAAEAELLRHWAEHGYAIIEGCIDPALVDAVVRDVDRAWAERWHVSIDILTPPENTFLDRCDPAARHGLTKLNQMHCHSEPVRNVFLHDRIVRLASLIFESGVVGVNSLTFEKGSQQTAHVDHVYMTPTPPRRVLAAWIALEDVAADSGPLEFWPGSHQLPPFRWSNVYPYHYVPEEQAEHAEYLAAQLHRFPRREFLARKGDVLLWHAMLAHGGTPIKTPSRSRKSMACHYFSLECYGGSTVDLVPHGNAWATKIPMDDPD